MGTCRPESRNQQKSSIKTENKSTSFPGSFPGLRGGAGKDPGIGLSRVHLTP